MLPYHGDERGTSVNGEVILAEASVTASAEVAATLQLTTDNAIRLPGAGDAPADSVAWINYVDATAAEIATATALRVHLNNFVAGPTSVGSLNMTLNTPDAHGGDILMNTTNGLLAGGTANQVVLDEAKPVGIDIIASSISGTVWEDVNGDSSQSANDSAIAGVTVELLRAGSVISDTVTNASGEYHFGDLDPGDYTVLAVSTTLPATSGNWANTVSPGSGSNGVSGVLTVGEGEDLADQDFGFRDNVPSIQLEKTGTAPASLLAGEEVEWMFTVTNTGNMDLTSIDLRDQLAGLSQIEFGTWPTAADDLLEPGQSVTATATSELTQAQLDSGYVTNDAAVNAVSSDNVAVSDDATATVVLPRAATIDLVKSVKIAGGVDPDQAVAGDMLEYHFDITNNGNVTIDGVTLTDTLPGLSSLEFDAWPNAAAPGVLLPGESVKASANLQLTQDHLEQGNVNNTASVTGNLPLLPTETEPQTVADSDTAELLFDPQPAIELQKSAHPEGTSTGVGNTIRYEFVLSNAGNAVLEDVALIDELEGLSEVEFGEWPDTNTEGRLAPGESVTATATLAVAQTHVDAGAVLNSATARGTTLKSVDVTATDAAEVVLISAPGMSFEKTGTLSDDGNTVQYGFVGTNTGDVTLHDVVINDKMDGLSAIEYNWPGDDGVLAPGQSVQANATYQVPEQDRGSDVMNEATMRGLAPSGAKLSDTDSAVVSIPAAPIVPEKVQPSLTVTGASGVAIWMLLAAGMLLAGGFLVRIRSRRKLHG